MSTTRRQFIAGTCAIGAAALLPGRQSVLPAAIAAETASETPAKPFTFVHLTDMHVTTRRQGHEGYRKCIESIRALNPKPDFVLMGGDLAFDGNYTEKAEFVEQIRLYKEITDSLGLPYYNCMGNHDVLGWSARRKVSLDDPGLGKKHIMDALGWEKSYYPFDRAGWHFVVLDSIYPVQGKDGPVYEPRIGREQLEWLGRDLGKAAGRPTVAVTHIAAFCNEGQIAGKPEAKAMDGSMVIWDTKDLRTVLERHKVKALLQGHSHRAEEYRFNGVGYVTSPAASGAWWAGSWTGSEPGYTVFRCDGERLTWEFKSFIWEPRLDPKDDLERKKIAEQKADADEQARLLLLDRGQ